MIETSKPELFYARLLFHLALGWICEWAVDCVSPKALLLYRGSIVPQDIAERIKHEPDAYPPTFHTHFPCGHAGVQESLARTVKCLWHSSTVFFYESLPSSAAQG